VYRLVHLLAAGEYVSEMNVKSTEAFKLAKIAFGKHTCSLMRTAGRGGGAGCLAPSFLQLNMSVCCKHRVV